MLPTKKQRLELLLVVSWYKAQPKTSPNLNPVDMIQSWFDYDLISELRVIYNQNLIISVSICTIQWNQVYSDQSAARKHIQSLPPSRLLQYEVISKPLLTNAQYVVEAVLDLRFMCLCTISGKAHRTTGSCSGLSKRKQTHTHPHHASVCTWTQTEPVKNPPPLQNLHHCYPETCQTGHGTGTTRG